MCIIYREFRFDLLKEWYDGYRFGNTDVYCPWDVLNQCDKFLETNEAPMEAHWENSSGNAIVKALLETATETTKSQIEALISGEAVEKVLIPELSYTDLESDDKEERQTYLWSVLYAAGYLTNAGRLENRVYRLMIPNREVLGIYENRIRSWFKLRIIGDTGRWRKFCEAMNAGEAAEVQNLLNNFMAVSINIRDTFTRKEMKENFYHGMILGLLQAEGSWSVKSNAESGIGYTDIRLEIPSTKTGCIIEVKYAENGRYEQSCSKAMQQIEDDGYAEILRQDGMQTIHKYGIACYKKSCRILYAKEAKSLRQAPRK